MPILSGLFNLLDGKSCQLKIFKSQNMHSENHIRRLNLSGKQIPVASALRGGLKLATEPLLAAILVVI